MLYESKRRRPGLPPSACAVTRGRMPEGVGVSEGGKGGGRKRTERRSRIKQRGLERRRRSQDRGKKIPIKKVAGLIA